MTESHAAYSTECCAQPIAVGVYTCAGKSTAHATVLQCWYGIQASLCWWAPSLVPGLQPRVYLWYGMVYYTIDVCGAHQQQHTRGLRCAVCLWPA